MPTKKNHLRGTWGDKGNYALDELSYNFLLWQSEDQWTIDTFVCAPNHACNIDSVLELVSHMPNVGLTITNFQNTFRM